jgi:flavorubredoxin
MFAIAEKIYWVGYIDWNLRNFHGYTTPYGSTYNAYLILDDQPTLIDTVKHYGVSEMLSRVKEIIDPAQIKHIISNHTEMDHSGAIAEILQYCPGADIICSAKGKEGLGKHFKKDWRFKVVATNDTLTIGKRTLKFFLTPMVHWPDSMATYLEKEAIVFSNDAFGQHYASYERYADQIGTEVILKEAAKYYANIVMPYGQQVLGVLNGLRTVKIDMICPSHGLIWRRKQDIDKIIDSYKRWASHITDKRVVIIYDTMWHSTEQIAINLFRLLDAENIRVCLLNLQSSSLSSVVTEVMNARVVLVGSSILNNHMLPTIGGLLTYLKGLKPLKRFGATFGSYGWSRSGFKELEDSLKEAGLELLDEGRYCQYIPDEQYLLGLEELINNVKDVLKE